MLLLAGVTGVALVGSMMLFGGEAPDDADAEPLPDAPDAPDDSAAEDRAAGLMALLEDGDGDGAAEATQGASDRPAPDTAGEDTASQSVV